MTGTNKSGNGPDEPDDPLEPRPIEPSPPDSFGLVQVWYGDGKGKTTAALGMGIRGRVTATAFTCSSS